MVSGLQGDFPSHGYLGPTYSRPVHHSAEQQGQAFFCRLLDPLALPGNPLQADWSKGLLYMYAPLPLLSLTLHRVIQKEAQVITILP